MVVHRICSNYIENVILDVFDRIGGTDVVSFITVREIGVGVRNFLDIAIREVKAKENVLPLVTFL